MIIRYTHSLKTSFNFLVIKSELLTIYNLTAYTKISYISSFCLHKTGDASSDIKPEPNLSFNQKPTTHIWWHLVVAVVLFAFIHNDLPSDDSLIITSGHTPWKGFHSSCTLEYLRYIIWHGLTIKWLRNAVHILGIITTMYHQQPITCDKWNWPKWKCQDVATSCLTCVLACLRYRSCFSKLWKYYITLDWRYPDSVRNDLCMVAIFPIMAS